MTREFAGVFEGHGAKNIPGLNPLDSIGLIQGDESHCSLRKTKAGVFPLSQVPKCEAPGAPDRSALPGAQMRGTWGTRQEDFSDHAIVLIEGVGRRRLGRADRLNWRERGSRCGDTSGWQWQVVRGRRGRQLPAARRVRLRLRLLPRPRLRLLPRTRRRLLSCLVRWRRSLYRAARRRRSRESRARRNSFRSPTRRVGAELRLRRTRLRRSSAAFRRRLTLPVRLRAQRPVRLRAQRPVRLLALRRQGRRDWTATFHFPGRRGRTLP